MLQFGDSKRKFSLFLLILLPSLKVVFYIFFLLKTSNFFQVWVSYSTADDELIRPGVLERLMLEIKQNPDKF